MPLNKPRLVVDTDVMLDYLRNRHPFHEDAKNIFDSVEENKFDLLLSNDLWKEYRDGAWHPDTLDWKTSDKIYTFMNSIKDKSIYYANSPHTMSMEGNSKDEHTINLAIYSKADFLVTRDKDVLNFAKNSNWNDLYPEIKVLHSRDFSKELSLWQEQQHLNKEKDQGPSY